MNIERLKVELERDEGFRLKPYLDTVGKTTIGVGRNLTDVGISDSEAYYLLDADIARAGADLDRALPWWVTLGEVRQRVLLNMCFNMGITGLLQFNNTLTRIKAGDWDGAAKGMMASLWARQVGPRATRLAEMMRTGAEPTEGVA